MRYNNTKGEKNSTRLTLSGNRKQRIQGWQHRFTAFQTVLNEQVNQKKKRHLFATTYALQIGKLGLQKVVKDFATS